MDRDPTVWPRLFSARVEREGLIQRRLQNTADELCEGALTPLLSHLVKQGSLSRKERKNLRSMLDDLDKETQ